MANTPAIPLSDDMVDRIAAEIGIQVAYHIETQYPAAAQAVAWESCKRSIQGVVRNAVASAGRAAEQGKADDWIKESRNRRKDDKANRRRADRFVADYAAYKEGRDG